MKFRIVYLLLILALPWQLCAQASLSSKEALGEMLLTAIKNNDRDLLAAHYLTPDAMWNTASQMAATANQAVPPKDEVVKMHAGMRAQSFRSFGVLQGRLSQEALVPVSLRILGVDFRPMFAPSSQLSGGMLKLNIEAEDTSGHTRQMAIQVDTVMWQGIWYWVGDFTLPVQ